MAKSCGKTFVLIGAGLLLAGLSGCMATEGNVGNMPAYAIPANGEADWIRKGEPIEFEGELWYPQDEVDNLLDSEMAPLGEYKGIQFFIENIDVRPYNQLFTKFGRNKFRIFRST